MIVVISGLLEDRHGNKRIAGAGKDEAAVPLLQNGFVSVAFADIMKRICVEVFGFTVEQLWGPSEERAKPDKRYPRPRHKAKELVDELNTEAAPRVVQGLLVASLYAGEPVEYLTVRYALQKLGDWGRDCYPDIWANKALEIIEKLLGDGFSPYEYFPQAGLVRTQLAGSAAYKGAVIPDCRFQNEFRRVKEEGGIVIRVKRKCDEFPSKLDDSHVSERDILAWGDEKFDHVIENNGTVAELHYEVLKALGLPTIKFPPVVSYLHG